MSELNYKEIRDIILKSNDIELERVYVKKWKCEVYIKQLTGDEQDIFEKERLNEDGTFNLHNFRARLVSMCLCDKEGKNIFKPEHIPELSKKNGAVLNNLVDKINKVNLITQDDIEILAKN